jgi:hypothetical protein
MQAKPDGQTLPQAPQLLLSEPMLTHTPLHSAVGGGQPVSA